MLKFPFKTTYDRLTTVKDQNVLKVVDRIELNISLLAFYRSVDIGASYYNLLGGMMDEYEDETGINEVSSSGDIYNAVDKSFRPDLVQEMYRPDSISTGLQGYWKLDGAFGAGYADPGFSIGNITGNAHGMAVAFTATSDYNVTRILMRFKKNGTPTWTYRIRLYAADGSNLPTGSILAQTGDISVSSYTTSQVTYNYALLSPYALTEGQNYCLAMEYVSGGTTPPDASHYIFSDGKIEANQPRMLGGSQKSSSDVWAALPATWIMYFNIIGDEVDYSPNGNNLTNTNYASSATLNYWGDSGSKLLYSANAQYFSIADASQTGLDITGSFTFAVWLNQTSTTSGVSLMDKGSDAYSCNLSAADGGTLNTYVGSQFHNQLPIGADLASTGKWFHLCWVFDDTANTSSVYLNGNLVNVVAKTVSPGTNSTQFSLGYRPAEATFNGLMKDSAIWNVALTPLQIKSLAMGVDLSEYAYRPNSVSTQPTSWWKLNEISNKTDARTRADSMGLNTLQDDDTTETLGGYIEGTGADFEYSIGNKLTITDALQTNLDITGSYSVAGWFKPESWGSAVITIYSKWISTGYMCRINASQSQYWNDAVQVNINWLKTLSLNTWYHMVFIYDEDAGTVSTYLDGVLQGSGAMSTTPSDNAHAFQLGVQGANTSAYDGLMSDVAIWKGYVLSESEIQNLASAFPVQKSGIISYWKMNEERAAKTVTPVADAKIDIGVTNPFGGKTGVLQLDGTGDYLSIPDSPDWNFGKGDFTIDCWVRFSLITLTRMIYNRGANEFSLRLNAGALQGVIASGVVSTYTWTPNTSQWYHLAWARSGGVLKMFVDGVQVDSDVNTASINSTSAIQIGANSGGTDNFFGSISEVRVSNGIARWTESFTPPTSQYETDSNTALLLHMNGYDTSTTFTDSSIKTSHIVTPFGDAQIDTGITDAFGGTAGCLLCDGTVDYLSIPDSSDWSFGIGDWTIDFWVRFSITINTQQLVTQWDTNSSNYFQFYKHSNNSVLRLSCVVDGEDAGNYGFTKSFSADTWYHVAIMRVGPTAICTVDGTVLPKLIYTDFGTVDLGDINGFLEIGRRGDGTGRLYGWMQEIRVSKGIARWTEDFTPLTYPYITDDYTKLLLHCRGTDASTSFPDSSIKTPHVVTAVANAQVDTSYSKFGSGSALMDGTGDWLSVPTSSDWRINTGDWTIDFWVRFTDISTTQYFVGQREDSSLAWYISKYADGGDDSNKLRWAFYGGAPPYHGTHQMTNTWSPANNTWYHLAFVRSGTTGYMFIDGVSQAVTTQSAFNSTMVELTASLTIGNYATGTWGIIGNMDEFRVSKGIARWTADFDVPTAPYETDEYTVLLLHCNGLDTSTIFKDSSTFTPETPVAYADAIGSNLLETVNSPTQVVGKVGSAANFEAGSSQYASITDALQGGLNLTKDFSLLAWAKPHSLGSSMYVIDKTSGSNGYGLRFGTTGLVTVRINGNETDSTGTTAVAGDWIHAGGLYTGAYRQAWVDGKLINQAAYSTDPVLEAANLGLGIDVSATGAYMDGILDEVIIAGRYFREEEMKSLFVKGNIRIQAVTTDKNMSLQSIPFAASAVPDYARIILYQEEIDAITLNTDLIASVSRDGGFSWVTVTLADQGEYAATRNILTGIADVSSQPSGSSMLYKIETANEKDMKIHAASMNW